MREIQQRYNTRHWKYNKNTCIKSTRTKEEIQHNTKILEIQQEYVNNTIKYKHTGRNTTMICRNPEKAKKLQEHNQEVINQVNNNLIPTNNNKIYLTNKALSLL